MPAVTEEFEPRYCVRCRRPIPLEVSDRQGACDECLAALAALAQGLSPEAMPPGPGKSPPCPNCGGLAVVREWRTNWITKAVDIAADVAGFLIRTDQHGPTLDPTEIGPARVLVYHCMQCDERWRPRR